jgi:hypothetical protein
MKGVFANCSKIADDLPEALSATDEEQMKIIFMFCSHKYEECKMNAIHQFHDQIKNDQSFDQSHDKHNPEEWKKHREEKIVIICSLFNCKIFHEFLYLFMKACAKKALGLS